MDRNDYRSMSSDPRPCEPFAELDEGSDGPVRLEPVFSGECFSQVIAYPLIVEGWEKKNAGRVRRRWLAEFTESERGAIGRYHARFYRWYLVTGTPHRVMVRARTVQLLRRAVAFFASI